MALYTDADFISGQDLNTLDSEVSAVAASQGITLDDPVNGMIHRSIAESAAKLLSYQQSFGGFLSNQSVSSNHYAAVMNTGIPAANRARVLANQVVVSDMIPALWTPLKTWAAYRALSKLFREVANRTTKDRYEEKSTRYQKLAAGELFETLKTAGLPVVQSPLPAPGALYDPTVAGVFDSSCVTTVAGSGTDTDNDFDIAVTWVAGTGGDGLYVSPTNKNNCESAPSAVVTMPKNGASGSVFQVSIATLTAPAGIQHPSLVSKCLVKYGNATGWNIYAGLKGGTLYLQNSVPVVIATKTYTFAGDPAQTGPVADTGQYPDMYFTFQNMLNRG